MRYFLVSLVLAVSIGGSSCGRKLSTGVSIDRELRPYVPPDANVLASFDLDRLKAAPLYQHNESRLVFPLMDASSERIGLDPRRDVSRVLVAWNGKDALFIARGQFSAPVVQQKLLALGVRTSAYGRYTLLALDRASLVFPKTSIAVAGSSEAVRHVLDGTNRHEADLAPEFEERLEDIPKGDQIWAVSRGGLPFGEMSMRSDYESALSNIVGYVRGGSLGIGIDTGAHIAADLTCASGQGAQRVHDALRAGIAFGRLSTKDNEQELLQIYDAIQVTQDKEIVRVRADYPANLAAKLIAYLNDLNFAKGRPNAR